MLNSINCSTVIRLPTVILMLLREATSETYGPRVYSHHINLHHFNLALLFYFALVEKGPLVPVLELGLKGRY